MIVRLSPVTRKISTSPASAFIPKPYNIDALSKTIALAINRQSVESEKVNEVNEKFREFQDKVKVDGEVVKITPIEFKILKLLLANKGRVFSIDEIYEKVWNEEGFGVENTVMVHIRHIREKLEINPKEPRYIKVVWGLGYKLEEGNSR